MERPLEIESLSLIQIAQMYTYSKNRKKNQWKKRKTNAIVNVYPLFKNIPKESVDNFETFCWSELFLYKIFLPHPMRHWHHQRKNSIKLENNTS